MINARGWTAIGTQHARSRTTPTILSHGPGMDDASNGRRRRRRPIGSWPFRTWFTNCWLTITTAQVEIGGGEVRLKAGAPSR